MHPFSGAAAHTPHRSIATASAISACPAPGVAHVWTRFETGLQDQHLVRRVGALFGVPDVARNGDQSDATGNIWQKGRGNLSVHAMRSRDVKVCRIGLGHLRPGNLPREIARRAVCEQRDAIAGSPLPAISFKQHPGDDDNEAPNCVQFSRSRQCSRRRRYPVRGIPGYTNQNSENRSRRSPKLCYRTGRFRRSERLRFLSLARTFDLSST